MNDACKIITDLKYSLKFRVTESLSIEMKQVSKEEPEEIAL